MLLGTAELSRVQGEDGGGDRGVSRGAGTNLVAAVSGGLQCQSYYLATNIVLLSPGWIANGG